MVSCTPSQRIKNQKNMKHIHILGICGTFMGSLAQLAVAKGFKVTGCDANVYPPMSTQLEQAGIDLIEGFDPVQLELQADLYIIGNAMSRGNPLVEVILDQGLPYVSGPQWLSEHILQKNWVLAVSGTHGKTTTSSMLAWILEYAGMSPGYLIGGVPRNFDVSARLGETPFFVIEADEYDSAFFDKRSKFIHYRPRTLVINNIEFDHGDIFDDLPAIQRQFYHLVRTVPQNGLVIYPSDVQSIDETLEKGCWTPTETISFVQGQKNGWSVENLKEDGSAFAVYLNGEHQTEVHWHQLGQHNVANGLAAMAAARHVGVTPEVSAQALAVFKGVKRRLECIYDAQGIRIYDDFAHHPTAIQTTLEGLRANVGKERIVVLIEPRSNTMRMGIHQVALAAAFDKADKVLWFKPEHLTWDLASVIEHCSVPSIECDTIDAMVAQAQQCVSTPCHIVIMSNGGFGGIHQRLIQQLSH